MTDVVELPAKEIRLLRFFVAMVLGRWDEVELARRDAPAGEPDREWRETVLQLHLFAGIPRQVEAYEVLARAGGLGEPDPDEAPGDPDLPERGFDVFRQIYGDNAESVRDRLHGFHSDFGGWVLGHAYGRVLARPGLSVRRRELLAVGALAALGQDRQLASHARGAVRCGAAPAEVFAALDTVSDLIREDRTARAREVLSRFARTKPPKGEP